MQSSLHHQKHENALHNEAWTEGSYICPIFFRHPWSRVQSLKLTVRPWKYAIWKGNDRIPTIHFQVQTVSFQGVYLPTFTIQNQPFMWVKKKYMHGSFQMSNVLVALFVVCQAFGHWLQPGSSIDLQAIKAGDAGRKKRGSTFGKKWGNIWWKWWFPTIFH